MFQERNPLLPLLDQPDAVFALVAFWVVLTCDDGFCFGYFGLHGCSSGRLLSFRSHGLLLGDVCCYLVILHFCVFHCFFHVWIWLVCFEFVRVRDDVLQSGETHEGC